MAEVLLQTLAVPSLAELPLGTPKEGIALVTHVPACAPVSEGVAEAKAETKDGLQLCLHCRKKPMSRRSYCGQFCGIKSRFKLLRPLQFNWLKSVLVEGRVNVCGLDGCDRPLEESKNLNARISYCSEDHRRLATYPCPNCKSKGLTEMKACCTPECVKALADSKKTVLLELSRTTDRFVELEDKFNTTWTLGTEPPKILHIYRIIMPKSLYQRFTNYRDTTGGKKEELRWHGTWRGCTVGNDGNTTMCNNFKTCFLCSILIRSFDAKKSKCGGVYTASTSGYSHNFSRDHKSTVTQAMLLGAVSHPAVPNVAISATPRNETVLPAYLIIYANTSNAL